MQIPLEITIRDFPRWEAVEDAIREKAARLEQFCDNITSCRVLVEAPHRSQSKGQLYHVRIDLTVPGREIVVKRDPPQNTRNEDVYVAVRDAFKAAQRRLQDYVRERRGQVKQHEVPPHGRVAKLFDGYGFIETPDGREIYFHENAVLNEAFESLGTGTEVRFTEEQGEKGPQASTVRVVGRHHHL